MKPPSAHVVIAGAGPVGLAMATGLARHGVASIVLEEDDELSRHSKAAGILPRTLEVLRAWGVQERFLAEGAFVTRAQIWLAPAPSAPPALASSEADRPRRSHGAAGPGPDRPPGAGTPVATVDLDVLRELTEFPGFLFIPQDKTERLLYEHASRSGLTDVRFGHRVVGFEQDRSGVSVKVEPRRGAAYELGTEYLIGCDGAHSAVRRTLGWSLEGKTYPTRLMLADVGLSDPRNELPWPRAAAVPEGVLAALRIEPELWRIIATVPPETREETATGEPEVARRVELLFGPGPFELVWAEVFRIHCRNSPHFRAGRVFLAGDAAHLNSPAGGMGMNSGIQDAHNLVWKLARALAGGERGGSPGREALLASYEEERRPAVLTNVDRYTDLLTRGILLAPAAVRTLFLGAAGIALRQRPIMRRIGPRIAMLDTHYRSRLIAGRGPLLGARAADGTLRKADGGELRLLDLVGREAALILFDDGRLPGWNVRQVEGLLSGIPDLKVRRLFPPWKNPGGADELVDGTGAIWESWHPGRGMAALIRPDGHVGWMADRVEPEDLKEGVGRALGV